MKGGGLKDSREGTLCDSGSLAAHDGAHGPEGRHGRLLRDRCLGHPLHGLGHVVQAVGYTPNCLRNSWDPRWGERGYVRISRAKDGETFVDDHTSEGVACKPTGLLTREFEFLTFRDFLVQPLNLQNYEYEVSKPRERLVPP